MKAMEKMSGSAESYSRSGDFEQAANPRLLRGMLREVKKIDRRLGSLPEGLTQDDIHKACQQDGAPAQSESENERDRARLRLRRHEVLDRILVEAIPFGNWVRCGRELVFVEIWWRIGEKGNHLDLYRLPARAARWIPSEAREDPQISIRRAQYARYRKRVMSMCCTGVLGGIFAAFSAVVVWSLPLSALLAALAIICLLAPGVYMLCDEYLWDAIEDGGPHEPFEVVAPGTGEESEMVHDRRRRACERDRERLLRRLAPWPKEPLQETHDYLYEYGGLGEEKASCRVRIYQGSRKRQAPVIAISQELNGESRTGSSSITSFIEAISAEVVLSELPHLLPRNRFTELWALLKPPFRVIEHYSQGYSGHDRGPGDHDGEATCVVTFYEYGLRQPTGALDFVDNPIDGKEVTITRSAKNVRPCLGDPEWHRLGREGARRMTGGQF